ncbi:asparaginase [Variovorax sp. PCZ-1]|uniref:asparaginase n=1 Tax=Variovorax sp. PCZ-1 TaxID=2835533 RepID=UPI001BD140F6|nr:asparaginase [Variovorax sp. PCZ-1]MBS7806735.1 asparaginase [Variovorax sp. PCZ-1]
MKFIPLIEYTRGDLSEIVHSGAIAVVNAQGLLLRNAGDAQALSFTRSTIKPFQALPFLQGGGLKHFGFDQKQTALLCASHNGEDMHVAQVDEMLRKVGQPTKALLCGCHVPLRFSYGGLGAPEGLQFDERHNNCSGKHTGFLGYCVQHGHSLSNYLAPEHPLQQAIFKSVMQATKADTTQLIAGTDGCSAPNYAMPLHNLAYGFARLASGEADSELGESFSILRDAFVAHPEMISGTARNDLAFTQAGRGDWITKIGADGVQVIASISRREAIAIKMISGNMPALYAAAVIAMDQVGWLDAQQREALKAWAPQPLLNVRGIQTGEIRAVFTL